MIAPHTRRLHPLAFASLIALGSLHMLAGDLTSSGTPALADLPVRDRGRTKEPPRESKEPEEGKKSDDKAEELSPPLHVGDTHTSKAGIKVRFVEVSSDSRCPSDVNCIWAGNATVVIDLTYKDAKPLTAKLNTFINPRDCEYAGNTISLAGLAPYPDSKTSFEERDYTARLQFKPISPAEKKPADPPKDPGGEQPPGVSDGKG